MSFLESYILKEEIRVAIHQGLPVVALESTVITHGLPYPHNLELAIDMENEVRGEKCIPATIALINGNVHVGIDYKQLEKLVNNPDVHKISIRDLGIALTRQWDGGTTVAGTMFIASKTGIRVLATGGIGGVHHEPVYDISADLLALAKTPLIVVCAGAKAILDLPATVEFLETHSIPVIGYQTDEFPGFYSRTSGMKAQVKSDSPRDVVKIANNHWGNGLKSAVLVVNPPPPEVAIPREQIEEYIERAVQTAVIQDIRSQNLTPFLLEKMNELSNGKCLESNLGLLRNNAKLAAQIARELHQTSVSDIGLRDEV